MFGNLVYNKRKSLGISLNEVSEMVNDRFEGKVSVTQSYLSKLEKGGYDSPSITNVLALTRVLGLDLREVLRNFGFYDMVNDSDESWGNDLISSIRRMDIRAPIFNYYTNSKDNLISLDQNEKKLIIEILEGLYSYGACSEDDSYLLLANIIKTAGQFRDSRIRKSKDFKPNVDNSSFFSINVVGYKVIFPDYVLAKINAEDMNISQEEIIDIVIDHKKLFYELQPEFGFTNEDKDVLVSFIISDKELFVSDVIRIF